jgi:hypothetical protein
MAVLVPTENAPRPWLTIGTPRPVAELPRVGDMPVVWITSYENGPDHEPVYTDYTNDEPVMACTCVHGVGRAVIGRQCPVRQRRSVLERRCSVCGKKINPGSPMICIGVHPREVLLGTTPGHTIKQDMLVSNEGPAHPACAVYSMLTCPHITYRLDEVIMAVTRQYQVFGGYKQFGEGPEHMVPVEQPRPRMPWELGPYYLSPLASSANLMTLVTFLRTAAPNNAQLPTLSQWDERFTRHTKGKRNP